MLIVPLKHEQMSARRWPLITLGLIVINSLIFFATIQRINREAPLGEIKFHLLVLGATHPELTVPDDAREFIQRFRDAEPEGWRELQDPTRPPIDEWEESSRQITSAVGLQRQMNLVVTSWQQLSTRSLLENWAFVPLKRRPITYLSSIFLHVDLMHLLGNMWFLWLAGFVLEDVWGRWLYAVFYLLAGIAGNQLGAWSDPGSFVPGLGASGAIAGLMGAFLVRFPKLKIEMGWLFMFRLRRFSVAAYWLLPLWLLNEVVQGTVFFGESNVGHWAHIGGFVFGAVAALGIKASGVEHKINTAIEGKIGLQAPPEIIAAGEHLDAYRYDAAIAALRRHLITDPNSIDAFQLLEQSYFRKGDLPSYFNAALKTIELRLKAREHAAAWAGCEEFLRAGGERSRIPVSSLMVLARTGEQQEKYDVALKDYEWVMRTHSQERVGLEAQLATAKVYLKGLNQARQALQLYEAALSSPVPHLDLMPTIESGIREAKLSMGVFAAGQPG